MKRTHFSFSYVRWKPRIGELASEVFLLRIWRIVLFLRAVVHILIQTLIIPLWLLLCKMIISQLKPGLPVQRIVGYIRNEGLEYWNTAKERRNLHSFDMKTSPRRAAIFFLRVSWILLPKWARVAYFPRKDSLKINHSVKTPWHRPSIGVERSK